MSKKQKTQSQSRHTERIISGDEKARIPTTRDVACVVAKGKPPDWLVSHFDNWMPTIMSDQAVEKMLPTRVEARELLEEIKRAAQLLRGAIGKEPSRWLLEGPPLGRMQYAGDLLEQLRDVEARASVALNSSMLMKADGTAPVGAGRAKPKEVKQPKVVVAGMIVLTWEFVRGKRAGAQNHEAWEAADKIWHAATEKLWRALPGSQSRRLGQPKDVVRGEDRPSGWRRYFREALLEKPVLGALNFEFLRTLREAKAQFDNLAGEQIAPISPPKARSEKPAKRN